jgi:ATP-dependent DNA ligase
VSSPFLWDNLPETTVPDELVLSIPAAEILLGKEAVTAVLELNADEIDEHIEETLAKKAGPVVNKRKREGIQLCKVYDPAKPPKWEEAYFEPKRNGYRCIARVKEGKAELLTSTGLPHWNVDHIKADLEKAAAVCPVVCDDIMLDGEVMHDSLDFDTAGGILRKHEPDERALGFYYHTWDMMSVEDFDRKQCALVLEERKKLLTNVVLLVKDAGGKYVTLNPCFRGKLREIVEHAKHFVIDLGEEGIVSKDVKGLYQFRKSGVWLKWKPKFLEDGLIQDMHDGDLRVTGAKEGRGKNAGMLGRLELEGYLLSDGNISPDPPDDEPAVKVTAGCGTGPTDAERIQMWKWFHEGTLVGRVVEVKFENVTKDMSLHHPVYFRFRPDKDEQ